MTENIYKIKERLREKQAKAKKKSFRERGFNGTQSWLTELDSYYLYKNLYARKENP